MTATIDVASPTASTTDLHRSDVHVDSRSRLPTETGSKISPAGSHCGVHRGLSAPVEVARTGLQRAVNATLAGERVNSPVRRPHCESARNVVAGQTGNAKVAREVDGASPEQRQLSPPGDRNAVDDDRAPVQRPQMLSQRWRRIADMTGEMSPHVS